MAETSNINNAAQYAINRTLSLTANGQCLGIIGDGYYKFIATNSASNNITEIEILNKEIISLIRNSSDSTSFGVKIQTDSSKTRVFLSDANSSTVVNVEYFDIFTFPDSYSASNTINYSSNQYSPNIKYFLSDARVMAPNIIVGTANVNALQTDTIEIEKIKIGNWEIQPQANGSSIIFSYPTGS